MTQTRHCPHCHKLILKDANFSNEAQFEISCQHCHKPVLVQVKNEIVISIEPKMEYNKLYET